jgi:putative ABC transport system permease protein
MASFFSVFVFFIYSMLVFHPHIEQGKIGDVSVAAMIVAEVILVLFSIFFIFYSMRAFLHARAKEFAILLQLGMERGQLTKLIFLETMIIGVASSIAGILFGFAFSKFFFMVVREILNLSSLPLYLSWEPFVVTLAVFLGAFILISYVSVILTPESNLILQLRGNAIREKAYELSKVRAILGVVLIGAGYFITFFLKGKVNFVIPIICTVLVVIGTYYFFTHSIIYMSELTKRQKKYYWKKSRILSISERIYLFKNNARIFFIVCIVSTISFISVGLLATLSSYTSQYDKMNPIGMIYKGQVDNPFETEHVQSLRNELEEARLSYQLTRFDVKRQTSSETNNIVEIFRESDINHLLYSFGYPFIRLGDGEAMFIPHSDEAVTELKDEHVKTVLKENKIKIEIDRVYDRMIFPPSIVSKNSIVLNDEDFEKIKIPYEGTFDVEKGYHLFAFDIKNWTKTDTIGVGIYQQVATELLTNETYSLPYYYENTGLSYSYILSSYSFFTLIGILVVAVFILAAGSFVYFRLYTNLEKEKKQFDMLKRIGVTDRELKRLITKQLLPQFFLPWGLALIHSIFAFSAIQALLADIYNITIVRELVIAFCLFGAIQIIYFFLIRWRYVAHLRN